MKKLILVAAMVATACGADDVAIDTGPTPATTDVPTTTTAQPTTTVEVTTTTTAVVEPEPVTTVPYVAPVTTRAPRATTTVPYEAVPSPQGGTTRGGDVWSALADCESGSQNVDTGNGYSGYLQFADATWRSLGYSGRAVDYSYATQVEAGQALQARSGWGQWPACARQLGLL